MDSKLTDNKKPKCGEAESDEGEGLKGEGSEFLKRGFHYGEQSASIPSRRQTIFRFFLRKFQGKGSETDRYHHPAGK